MGHIHPQQVLCFLAGGEKKHVSTNERLPLPVVESEVKWHSLHVRNQTAPPRSSHLPSTPLIPLFSPKLKGNQHCWFGYPPFPNTVLLSGCYSSNLTLLYLCALHRDSKRQRRGFCSGMGQCFFCWMGRKHSSHQHSKLCAANKEFAFYHFNYIHG